MSLPQTMSQKRGNTLWSNADIVVSKQNLIELFGRVGMSFLLPKTRKHWIPGKDPWSSR